MNTTRCCSYCRKTGDIKMMGYIQEAFSTRIGGRSFGKADVLYKFEQIKQAKREAMQQNPLITILDFGVGEPDWMAEEEVIQVLADSAANWDNRGYSDNGSIDFM